MSVIREKVCDDPLSAMMGAPEPEKEKTTHAPQPRKPHTHNLKNTLSSSDDDFMKFEPKKQSAPRGAVKSSAGNSVSHATTTSTSSNPFLSNAPAATSAPAPAPAPVPKKPTGPTSVFESEEDIFLKGQDSAGVSAATQRSLEDELFGPSATPMGALANSSTSSRAGLGRFGASYEDEFDEKVDDLGVSNIMEREVLDFDLFGKSNVRQMDGADPSPAAPIYQEDLRLESEDEFAAMEAVLNSSSTSYSTSKAATSTFASEEKKQTVFDASNLSDIDAYISQQQGSEEVSLFD